MSYEKCKYIKLDKKNNKIIMNIASNNVYPLSYTKFEFYDSNIDKYKNYTFEDKLILLYESFDSGCLQISSINDNTENFEYALKKARQYNRDNGNANLWDNRGKIQQELSDKGVENAYLKAIYKVYGDSFKVFKKALYEKIEGKYNVIFNNYYYVSKFGKYDRGYYKFFYGFSKPLETSYKRAYIFTDDLKSRDLKIVKVK